MQLDIYFSTMAGRFGCWTQDSDDNDNDPGDFFLSRLES